MKKINLSHFKNEDDERKFWAKINLADYFNDDDFSKALFPNLKPTSRSISIRLPEFLIISIKEQANELNIPYQSLMKKYLAQGTFKNK